MDGRLPLTHCQRHLAVLWLVACVALVTILLFQTQVGRFGADYQRAWSWLIPQIFPTLSVIIGGISYGILNQQQEFQVDKPPYQMALWFSAAYLLIMLLTLLIEPDHKWMTNIQWLDASKLWFTALNASVNALLGAFFVSSKPK